MQRTDATLQQEINLGETVCRKLRAIYFSEIAWSECYRLVAQKFCELKVIARKFYADKNEIEMLMELSRYSSQDLQDMMSI